MGNYLTIKDMQERAALLGGKCLSKRYTDGFTPLEWMCEHGHRWSAGYYVIRQGGWCRQCARGDVQAERLKELQVYAKKKGGKCLSLHYINSQTRMKWQCKYGHEWFAKSYHIKGGHSWCPYCSGKAMHTINDMHELSRKNDGRCLSLKYINSMTKLKWECKEGHRWMAKPTKILIGQWCPECRYVRSAEKLKDDISKYQKIARQRGGRLLSKEYKNALTHALWQCAKGHRWLAKPGGVKFGTWCPVCARHPNYKTVVRK
jgi:hypothetical protein